MSSENNTGMSGGTNNGGIAIGKHSGVASTHNAPGKVSNTQISDCSNVTKVDDVSGTNVTIGGGGPAPCFTSNNGSRTGPSQEKDIQEYTVTDIKELLQKERFPETVVTKFENSGIDGKFFMGLMEEGVLKELGVESALDKMKIRKLVDKFYLQKS